MSLLDKPQKTLCKHIFTFDEKMRPEVRLYVLKDIFNILDPKLISGIYFLGSLAGRQYTQTSDMDINIILMPGLDRRDFKEYVKQYNHRPLHGTLHEVGYYVQNYSKPSYHLAEFGVYNLIEDRWESLPRPYEEIRDPDERFFSEIAFAKMILNTFTHLNEETKKAFIKELAENRKTAYKNSWGTPRESQENILYKYIEKSLGKRLEKLTK